jgi:hypothetical protein
MDGFVFRQSQGMELSHRAIGGQEEDAKLIIGLGIRQNDAHISIE